MSTEKATQKAILDWLTLTRTFHYRNNSGAFVSEYKGKRSFVKFGASGSPDIVVVKDGIYIGIEVKDTRGRLSESQVDFRDRLEKAGGLYLIARSLEDVIEFFNNFSLENID